MANAPLHVIHVSESQVVLKRGLREMLVTGSEAAALCDPLVALLSEHLTDTAVLDRFPEAARPQVKALLEAMRARHLIESDGTTYGDGDRPTGVQEHFYAQLESGDARTSLAAATVVIHGVNRLTRTIVGHFEEMGVGTVITLPHARLDSDLPAAAAREVDVDESDHGGGELSAQEPAAQEPDVVIAACDSGRSEALLDLNRAAVSDGLHYLPVWMEGFTGHVGPLVVPGESACLRCYVLRRESNDERPQISAALQRHATTTDEGRRATAMLPPMPAAVGAVAAMEVGKLITGAAPRNAIGRALELNLVSFAAAARRVLKVPRCTDCSELARRGTPVVLAGPQIPGRWIGLHAERGQ